MLIKMIYCEAELFYLLTPNGLDGSTVAYGIPRNIE